MTRNLQNVLCLGLVVSFLSGAAVAQHPTHPAGFSPEKAYEVGLMDNVDLFSGALSLSVPVGPLNLTYSSSGLWSYETVDLFYIRADPHKKANAGFGWRLGFGDIYHKNHWYNSAGRWQFIDENGGSHIFNSDLHRGEDDGDPDVYYSRDNSYLRFREININTVEIEFPDGTTRRYEEQEAVGGENRRLRFVSQWSRFGSYSDPDLEVSYSFDPEIWTITDRYGRTHYVTFGYDASSLDDAVTEIDLESYQGQRKVFGFAYENKSIKRSCKDTDPNSGVNITVSFLTQIVLPDGTSYQMKDGSDLLYDQDCHDGLKEAPGTLLGILLPTGGKYSWDYRLYSYPDPDPVWSDNVGVKSKTVKDRDDNVLGVWTYKNEHDVGGGQPEVRTQVVYPTGDCSRHHFNGRYWLSANPARGWEYGLPFAYSQEDNGFYLSEEIFESSSGENCAGTKLRSLYVKYDHDELPDGTIQPEWWYNSNRRRLGMRTVFHDDADAWIETNNSQFDGLGHYREKKTTSSFWDGSTTSEERVYYVNYNLTSGTYPGSYVPVPTTTPWLTEVYDYEELTESDALGESVVRIETGFDASTGVTTCRRTLTSGSTRSATDVLVTYAHDSLGRVTDIKTYGGDLQALSTTGPDCGDVPAAPEYWFRNSY